jgi:hypothetical protein
VRRQFSFGGEGRLTGIKHKVNIFNEACHNGSLNTGTPFDNIPGAGWPLAECRIETLGDQSCEKNFPLYV